MTEYNEGDLVEAVKDGTIIRGKAWNECTGGQMIGSSGWTTERLENIGFTLTVIEKAAPKNVLPTEAGAYADREGDFFIVYEDGDVQSVQVTKERQSAKRRPISGDSNFAPFTRLEPVPVTAKKVLDALWELNDPANTVVATTEKTPVIVWNDLVQIGRAFDVEMNL